MDFNNTNKVIRTSNVKIHKSVFILIEQL